MPLKFYFCCKQEAKVVVSSQEQINWLDETLPNLKVKGLKECWEGIGQVWHQSKESVKQIVVNFAEKMKMSAVSTFLDVGTKSNMWGDNSGHNLLYKMQM